MIADAFHDRRRAGVADAETFSRHAVDIGFSAGRSVQRHISYDHIFIGLEADALRRIDDELAAGKSFPEVIVAVADEFQCQPLRDECAEALTARSAALHSKCIFFQRIRIALRDLRTEDCSQRPVGIAHVDGDAALLFFVQRRLKFI